MTTHSQRARILYRRRRFINHLLTYLQLDLATYHTESGNFLCMDVDDFEKLFWLVERSIKKPQKIQVGPEHNHDQFLTWSRWMYSSMRCDWSTGESPVVSVPKPHYTDMTISCRLVYDTANHLDMSLTTWSTSLQGNEIGRQVGDKLANSPFHVHAGQIRRIRCNVIWALSTTKAIGMVQYSGV